MCKWCIPKKTMSNQKKSTFKIKGFKTANIHAQRRLQLREESHEAKSRNDEGNEYLSLNSASMTHNLDWNCPWNKCRTGN